MSKFIKELIKRRGEVVARKAELDEEIAGIDSEIAKVTIEEHEKASSSQAPRKRAPRNQRKLDPEKLKRDLEGFTPVESGCLCGCGEEPEAGKDFVTGHWKRLERIARGFEAGIVEREKLSEAGYKYASSKGWIVE